MWFYNFSVSWFTIDSRLCNRMMSEGRGCSMRWQKIWSEIENTHFIKIDMVKDSFILLVDVGIASSFDNNTTKKSITNISLMMYSFYGIDHHYYLVCIFLSCWYNTISLFLKKILMYLQFFTFLYKRRRQQHTCLCQNLCETEVFYFH